MAGIYSQGGSAGHRYAGWLSEVEAKNFIFGGKVFNGSPSAIYVGSNLVWAGRWLTVAAAQDILGAFGQRDGLAVINATNAYLNQLAASDRDKATALAGFINQHPLDAALYGGLYVQDGLVFQMDRAYECTAAKWKDFIGGVEFNGTNVQIVDDVPYFNGAAYYKGPEQNHLFASYTLEVVYKGRNTNTSLIFMENGTSGASRVSMGILSASELLADSGNTGHPSIRHSAHTSLTTVGVAGDSIACVNGESASRGGSNNWSHNGVNNCFIGARYEGGQCFNGDIIAIRIYNRLLTKAEILANQDIDLKRFTPSTP